MKGLEALQELFGNEMDVSEHETLGLLLEDMVLDVGDTRTRFFRPLSSDEDNAYICRLIDEKLRERRDVDHLYILIEDDGVYYTIDRGQEWGVTALGEDPLTARLEALTKLFEAQSKPTGHKV